MGGGLVPYQGYVEVHLQIPRVKKFDEDVNMPVLENSPYGDRVPIKVGLIMQDEIDVLTRKWKKVRLLLC